MKEDMRVCPYCHKAAPVGKVWKDFEAHKRVCLQHLKAASFGTRSNASSDSDIFDLFETIFAKTGTRP